MFVQPLRDASAPPSKPLIDQHPPTTFDKVEKFIGVDNADRLVRLPIRYGYGLHSPDKTGMPNLTKDEVKEMLDILQPGDVILCGNNGSFVHAIVYVGNGEIVHSLATEKLNRPENLMDKSINLLSKGISKLPLLSDKTKDKVSDYVQATPRTIGGGTGVIHQKFEEYLTQFDRDNAVIVRPKQASEGDRQKIVAYAKAQVGKGYDYGYNTYDDKRFYCTELAARALGASSKPPALGTHMEKSFGLEREVVTNEELLASPDLEPVWKSRNYEMSPFGKQHPVTVKK